MLLCLSSTTFFSIVFLLVFSGSVYGWGLDGHALVAGIAQTLLTSESLTFVRDHLPSSVAGNMSMVASWADNILHPDPNNNWEWSKQLHYVDTQDWTCGYDQTRDCNWTSGQRCVDGAIQNYTSRLADSQQDPIQRQQALEFLIHFVGDAHQPLHAGFKSDLGGNEIYGHFFGGRRIELHQLWDSIMIERRISEEFRSQPQLYLEYLINKMKNIPAQNISDWTNCSSSDESRFLACSIIWIQEDAKLDCDAVYIDENGQRITKDTGFNLGQIYYTTRMDIVERRLIQGGLRLATVINKIVQSTTHDKKSNKICLESMTLMVVILGQFILILVFLSYIFLRRKPTTIIIQPPVFSDKKEYLANA